MRVEAHLSGNLPRGEALFRALRRHSRGKAKWEEVRATAEAETAEWVRLQAESGLNPVTDPMLLWHDHFRPFAENVKGMAVDGLRRWYDNNVFYRAPVVFGRLGLGDPFLDRYLFPSVLGRSEVKLVLPDPLTFAKLSVNNGYQDLSELAMDLAEVTSAEASKLVSRHGLRVVLVQLSAPELAREPKADDLELVREEVGLFRRRLGCKVQLHTFFFSAARSLRSLLDTGADLIGIDLHATPVPALRGVDVDRELAIGVVDSRSVVVEDPEWMASLAERAVEATGAKAVHFTTNTDLDFLPVDVAREKVHALSACARLMRERWGT
ncbi:MAG: hypothetical protein ABDH63_03000 [Candidatus Caldarchaeales archaeon]